MLDDLPASFVHLLAGLILLGRLGDVGSTLFISPRLALEANALVRRFPRPVMLVGFLLCLAPYLDPGLGIAVAVPSLLVTASNLSRGWLARAAGEADARAFMLRAVVRGSRRVALTMVALATAFFLLAAGLLVYLSDGPGAAPFWFGVGMTIYAIAVGVHSSLFIVRLFATVRAAPPGAA